MVLNTGEQRGGFAFSNGAVRVAPQLNILDPIQIVVIAEVRVPVTQIVVIAEVR